jgi:hypothetical protein
LEESAFLAEQRPAGLANADGGGASDAEEEKGDLPPLDDLVQRIPPATRELVDEIFRAKFITVRRIPKSALKG